MTPPERLIIDKLSTPTGHTYRIHAWRDGKFVRATVVPYEMAISEREAMGFSRDGAEALIEAAEVPPRKIASATERRQDRKEGLL